jgi:lipopolysaccharide transport system ATP-binding protein
MTVVVKVENVSKKYQLGTVGTQSLKGDFHRWWSKMRGKEDPFAKIGDESQHQNGDFWALKDINFEINQGEAIGIIGKNGAGKSTLLKILSRITNPTTGSVKVKGRIASLLEVGTGFNPDLTGRENIYLNGAILGMTKREVKAKFDEIVDFSGVAKFIDTPVKRYSSGMYVRLAFAVAAHLESEILILDEVLAVGDAEFQKKCLGKMDDVAHKQGRTIIFVSHSIASVQQLCERGLLLNGGRIEMSGDIEKVANYYEKEALKNISSGIWINQNKEDFTQLAYIKSIEVLDSNNNLCSSFSNTDSIKIRFTVVVKSTHPALAVGFDLIKNNILAFRTQDIDSKEQHKFLEVGEHKLIVCIPEKTLNVGQYLINPLLSLHCLKGLMPYAPVLSFQIAWNNNLSNFHKHINDNGFPGAVFPLLKWENKFKTAVYEKM